MIVYSSKPRILHLITGLEIAGAEMALLKLLERTKGDFEHNVISLKKIGVVGERIKSLGVPVFSLSLGSKFLNPFSFLKLIFLIKKINPDIVQTWLYHADLIGGIFSKILGKKRIVWNIRITNFSQKEMKWRTRMVVKMCAFFSKTIPFKIISVSKKGIEFHEKIGYDSKKFVFIPNGIDLSKFFPDKNQREIFREELKIPKDSFLIGHIARFHPQKNHLGFIKACQIVLERFKDIYFVMVGKGVDWHNKELKKAIEETGKKENFFLFGERKDVPKIMQSLDLFVLSSLSEGFPNVLIEAMACQVPVVTTDVGDCKEIVDEEGKIVPKEDERALAKAMIEILELSPKEREKIEKRVRKIVEEKYEIGKIAKQYSDFYFSLLRE